MRKSYLKNCIILPREDDNVYLIDDGRCYVQLDGYAIVPVEHYRMLNEVAERKLDLVKLKDSE